MLYQKIDLRCFFCLFFMVFVFLPVRLEADEIYLNNGDRITGQIVNESKEDLTIKTKALGTITIEKHFVDRIEQEGVAEEVAAKDLEPKEKPSPWNNELELGYAQSGGNTETQSGSAKLSMSRKTLDDEWTIKASGYYSSSNKKIDTKKYLGLLRYAFSFGKRKWYNFYKLEGNRDRFANIDYRIIPSTGIGYWFSDTPEYKALAEIGIGLEHTNFRDNTKTTNEAILIPRAFLEKTLFGQLALSQEIILYPSLSEFGDYRLYSQTNLTNPINEALSLRFSFIDEFNSDPPGGTKRNDFSITSSLVYTFQ